MQLFPFLIFLQILGLVCDNASNNDTLVVALVKLIPAFREEGHIRCLGHVFNLCVRALLQLFSRGLGKRKDGDANDEWAELLVCDLDAEDKEESELDEEAEEHDEEYLTSLEEEVDMESSRPKCTPEDVKEAVYALFKVKMFISLCTSTNSHFKILNMAKKVHWSSILCDAFCQACLDHGLPKALVLIRAVANCWNTHTSMIGHAFELKDVYNDVCDMARYNDRTMHLYFLMWSGLF